MKKQQLNQLKEKHGHLELLKRAVLIAFLLRASLWKYGHRFVGLNPMNVTQQSGKKTNIASHSPAQTFYRSVLRIQLGI